MGVIENIMSSWETLLFENAAIKAYTDKAYVFKVTEASEFETAKLYYNQEINFIDCKSYVVYRPEMTRSETAVYTVIVNYTREQDTEGENYKSVRDFFETLNPLVRTVLGSQWNSIVDYYMPGADSPQVTEIEVDNRACWTASKSYEGIILSGF